MIEIKNASKSFGKINALENVSCSIQEGSIFGIVGSNGAGKSTLLRVLCGVYDLDEGQVTLDGETIYENPQAKRDIVFLSDSPAITFGLTLDRLRQEYAVHYTGFDSEEYDELLRIFDLDSSHPISSMSKGMRRQAMIIIALCCNTRYIVLDETLDGLDAVIRGLVKKKIYKKVIDTKTTVIISSHSLRELEDFCDSLILIHKGDLVFEKQLLDMDTVLIKVQIALEGDFDQSKFEDIEVVKYRQQGTVANLLVKGTEDSIIAKLQELEPILLETVPLSLEEIFTYELEERGYAIDEEYVSTQDEEVEDDE